MEETRWKRGRSNVSAEAASCGTVEEKTYDIVDKLH